MNKTVPNLYVRVDPSALSAMALENFAREAGVSNLVPAEKMHITTCFSREPVMYRYGSNRLRKVIHLDPATYKWTLMSGHPVGDRKVPRPALVLEVQSDELQDMFLNFRKLGASFDYPTFRPHMTVSYDWQGTQKEFWDLKTPDFTISIVEEIAQELNFD